MLSSARVWHSNSISFASKFKLYKSLVTFIFVYGCETRSMDSEKSIQAFKTMCLRKLLQISYLELKTNDWVWCKINFPVGPKKPLLATVKRWKLAWYLVCNTQRQPLQNQSSKHLGGWTTPWLAEEMLDGQRQRVDIPAHAQTAQKGS